MTSGVSPEEERELMVELIGLCSGFEGDEVELLVELARRLKLGKERYGNFDVMCAKAWLQEADEEDLDGLAYRTAHIIKERRKRESGNK